jgi:hypothetical protein
MRKFGTIAGGVLIVVLVGVAIFWSGKRGDNKSGLDIRVSESVAKIEEALGMKFRQPPVIESRSKEEVRAFLLAQFEDTSTARELAGQELVLKRLGMFPEELSLRQVYLDVLEEQIAGYYDPRTKVLYVVDGSPEQMRDITVTHELIHALQDQYLPLDSIQNIRGRDDHQIAAQAVIEGQATFEQMRIMFGEELGVVVPGGWDGMRKLIRDEQSKMPKFANAPFVVQEMLLFPYLSGADFAHRFSERRQSDTLLRHIPVSTEQLLHTDAFFSDSVDQPTELELPPLNGVTRIYENTMGEFGVRLFLFEMLRQEMEAMRGAMGWDGDRYVLFRTGESTGIAWVTVWDSPFEAAEFRNQISQSKRYLPRDVPAARRPGTIYGEELVEKNRTIYLAGAEIGGKPAVIYVDVPQGTSWDVLDVRKIRIVP